MYIPSTIDTILAQGDPLSDNPSVRRLQLSRLSAYTRGDVGANSRERRAKRNAEYKSNMARHRMDAETREAIDKDPTMRHGLPMQYKILAAGRKVAMSGQLHADDQYVFEGNTLHFAAFGIAGRPVRINNKWIHPDGSELTADQRVYSLSTLDDQGKLVSVHLDFAMAERPAGYIETINGLYAIRLEAFGPPYDVAVSANKSLASWDQARKTLVWHSTSPEWKLGPWETNSMGFRYGHGKAGRESRLEASYEDRLSKQQPFELLAPYYDRDYTATLVTDTTTKQSKIRFAVDPEAYDEIIPSPPKVRENNAVKSVFPAISLFEFDRMGMSFQGAYAIVSPNMDNPTVYAVQGTVPDVSTALQLDAGQTQDSVFFSNQDPIPTPFETVNRDRSVGAGDKPKSILPLLSMDPVFPDPSSPSKFTDVVTDEANKSFYDIICYYMDDDLYKTFISSSPATLEPEIRAIATNDPRNRELYKALQVPYLVSALSGSTVEEARDLNKVRAPAQLKSIPATDEKLNPIYNAQMTALYRHHFKRVFLIDGFLYEQGAYDWSETIDKVSQNLKEIIGEMVSEAKGDENAFKETMEDVDKLTKWVKDRRLLYAFMVYEKCTTWLLPLLSAQIIDGQLSEEVSKTIKKITTVLGVLENGEVNYDGPSCVEAFNKMVQTWHMLSLTPQLVDPSAALPDFAAIILDLLRQFVEDAERQKSKYPILVEDLELAKAILESVEMRKDLFKWLAQSMRLAAGVASLKPVMDKLETLIKGSKWYDKITKLRPTIEFVTQFGAIVCLIMPLIGPGGWNGLSAREKGVWIASATGLTTSLIIRLAEYGAPRVTQLFRAIGSWAAAIRGFGGISAIMRGVPNGAAMVQTGLLNGILRTAFGGTAMQLTGPGTVGRLTNILTKIFNKSVAQFLTRSIGVILAGLNIVLSIIDAVKSNEPLEKAFYAMMIISSGLQILAVAASWVAIGLTALGFTAAAAVLNVVAAVLGPLVIVFAIIGLILLLVYIFTRKPPEGPVAKFIREYAEPAGLKCAYYTAIDYFNVVPADKGDTSLNGISFGAKPARAKDDAQCYLTLDPSPIEDGKTYRVKAGTDLRYDPEVCWCVTTDYRGYTKIFTYVEDEKGDILNLCLTQLDDGTVVAKPPIFSYSPDAKDKDSQLWKVDPLTESKRVNRTIEDEQESFVQSGQFQITRKSQNLMFIANSDGTVSLTTGTEFSQFPWTLNLVALGPSNFDYVKGPTWQLYLDNTVEFNPVLFATTSSMPLQWQANPPLPPYLEFGDPDSNPGTIQQKKGQAPSLGTQTYEIRASIRIGRADLSKKTLLTIVVAEEESGSSLQHHSPSKLLEQKALPLNITREAHMVEKASALDVSPPIERQLASAAQYNVNTFFEWEQTPRVQPMNEHCTGLTAIAWMSNALQGDCSVNGRSESWKDLFFPNAPPLPTEHLGRRLSWDYAKTATAFVLQKVSDSVPNLKDSIDFNKTVEEAGNFNYNLKNANPDYYIAWLASQTDLIAGCTKDQYYRALTSPYWTKLKTTQFEEGVWHHATYEMFMHFLKYAALGASDNEVIQLYQELTEPTGDGWAMPMEIFPVGTAEGDWKDYRGYLSYVPITYNDLDIQNVDEVWSYVAVPSVPAPPVTIRMQVADLFLRGSGFED